MLTVPDCWRATKARDIARSALAWLPVGLLLAFIVGLNVPTTSQLTLWMLAENRPVELLTFASLVFGVVQSGVLIRRLRNLNASRLVRFFYVIFGGGLALTALEEVAWGQGFVSLPFLAALRDVNVQGEVTIHNMPLFHGHSEILRLLFGLGGLTSIGIGIAGKARYLASPPSLLPWFLVISVHAGIDVYNDVVPISPGFDFKMQRLSELIELLIAMSAVVFLMFQLRKADVSILSETTDRGSALRSEGRWVKRDQS